VTELDRRRVATVLTADSHLETGTGFASALDSDAHQLTDAVAIDHCEGILLENAFG